MKVVDASAVVLGLLNDGEARRLLSVETLAVPHLADPDIAQALRRQVLRGAIPRPAGLKLIETWVRFGVRRFGVTALLPRVWELAPNLTAYDATYAALAEALGCDLITADARLASAPGPMCSFLVVKT